MGENYPPARRMVQGSFCQGPIFGFFSASSSVRPSASQARLRASGRRARRARRARGAREERGAGAAKKEAEL